MSVKMMAVVWELDLGHPEQSVLLALADHANDEGGDVFPSVGRVAWKTGYSERQVKRLLARLCEMGAIRQEAPPGFHKPTEYALQLDAVRRKPPFEPTTDCSPELRRQVIEAFEQTCEWCHQPGDDTNGPDGGVWNVDRIVPGVRWGRYEPDNVTLACGTCNKKKGANLAPLARSLADVQKGAISDEKGAIAMAPEPSLQPSVEQEPKGTPSAEDANPNQPSEDQLYLARAISTQWMHKRKLDIPQVVKLNKQFGRVCVTDAMRAMHGPGNHHPNGESLFAYLAGICHANADVLDTVSFV